MKIIYAFILATFAQAFAIAQSSNLIIFAEDPTPFYAIVNGIKQNNEPQTNVKITGLTNPAVRVKIVFADGTTPDVDKNLYFENMDVEVTTKITNTKKGYKLRYFGEVAMGQAPINDNQAVIVYSTTPTQINANNNTKISQPNTNTSTTTVTEETVTTTTSTNGMNTNMNVNENSNGTNENVNVNMNVGGFGVNMNVDVNDNGMNTSTSTNGNGVNSSVNSSTTTTTTTTTSTTTSGGSYFNQADMNTQVTEPVVYVPGYTGNVGCAIPQTTVNDITSAIDDEDFSDDKIMIAKQALKNKCVTAEQVKTIMEHFDFEDKKLEFAKYAYDYTYDQGNYYKVNKAFDFSSSKEELNEYISKR